jgi:PAS domain S-box-containing protein
VKDDDTIKKPVDNDRQQAGDILRETELRYRTLFRQSPDGILIIDTEGKFIDFNEAAHLQLGYSREEFEKLRIADIDPYQSPEEIRATIEEVFKKGSAEFEVKHKTKGGEIRDVQVITQLMELSSRTVFHTIWRDVTEHKRADEALAESEKKYRDLFENANDAIFIVGPDLQYIDVNNRATELFGFSREEYLTMRVLDVIPPEQIPRSEAAFTSLREKGSYEKFTGKTRTKDGHWLDVEVSSSAIIQDGKIVGSRDIVRDITERKRAEEALRSSENFLQTIIETEPECVKLVASDGALLMMNRAGLAMIEADSLAQVKGQSIYPLVALQHREAFKAHVEAVFKGKQGMLEFDVVGIKGRRLCLESHSVPLRNAQDEIIALLGITRDITEHKKLEEELVKAQKLESVGLLAGGIAHDFNNLLTAILGNINLAKVYLKTGDKAFDRIVEAEKASFRAKDLTHQLLTFSKGGAPVKKTASIAEVIQESARFALRGSKVQCDFIIPNDLRPVEIDEGQMSQVVNNLIINADQAMPGGGMIRVECRNVIVREAAALPLKEGNHVKISFEDHGIGIAPEHLSRIFDPYFTTKETGSGLGLATTYSIIKRHDGAITVESTPGVGTTFHIYLPASEARNLPKKVKVETSFAGVGKILVMDDEKIVREVVAEILKNLGYEVEVAKDGAEVITLYTKAKESGKGFHAVIMDITVPGGMGGEAAIKKLREFDPGIKAIVSSGYSNDPIMAHYGKYGFKEVIEKPYTSIVLGKILHKVLAGP